MRKLKRSGSNKDLLSQAAKMQEQMLKMQDEISNTVFETSAAGGLLTLKMNGKKEILDIKISMDLLKDAIDENDEDLISNLIKNTINELGKKVDEKSSSSLGSIAPNLNIPGIF